MDKPVKVQKTQKIRKKLGDYLVEAGFIDNKTLLKALEMQKTRKKKIGQILIDMGANDDIEVAKSLGSQLKIPFLRLDKINIPQEVTSLIPSEMAENYMIVPIKKTEKGLLVAMANPLELYALDDLRFFTQMPIDIAVAPQKDILKALEQNYPSHDLEKALYPDLEIDKDIAFLEAKDLKEEKEEEVVESAATVRFINAILSEAVRLKASDIHVEPQKTAVIIRYRIDGILREIMQINKLVHLSLVSRIKIISNIDISIRRKPQDGKAQIKHGKKVFDLRVSSLPTSYGEKITIRILNPDMARTSIKDLGFSDNDFNNFVKAISTPQGIIIVTGPTGSGKSTTLYSCLNKLNTPDVNIITVEDPVEYDVDGINQVQINPKAGITFASGLRSILRQDPDIVLVGEIRDSETASIAVQAAQTGHLVLTTLHTNDTPSSLIRLFDLGIDPFVIGDALIAVIGQRLVRGICQECKIPDPLSPQILKRLPPNMVEDKSVTFWKGAGCEACQYTGYLSRIGIFELLMITPSLKKIIKPNVSAHILKEAAESDGFQSMAMDGMLKAIQGRTTIEEVFRVAPPEANKVTQKPIMEFSLQEAPQEAPQEVPQEVLQEAPQKVYQEVLQEASQEVLQEEIGMEKPEPDELPVNRVKPVKILVADDNPIVLKMLYNILEAENYLVITAKDGEEAMKLTFQDKPDLIVTDCIMPKMDGLTFIKKLRSQLSTRYIPIVMLTAEGEVDSEVEAIYSGADDYISKSISPKKLIARINRLIRRL